MIKLPDGTVKILVEGIQRAKLKKITTDEGYFAEIEKIEEVLEDSKYERDLLSTIKNQFTEFLKKNMPVEEQQKIADDLAKKKKKRKKKTKSSLDYFMSYEDSTTE